MAWSNGLDDWVDVCGTSRLDEGGAIWLDYTTQFMAMTGKSWENGKINHGNWGSSISRQIHIPIIPRWFWREQSEQIWTVQAMFDGGRTEPTVQLDRKPSVCYQSTRWRQCKRAAALGIWTEMRITINSAAGLQFYARFKRRAITIPSQHQSALRSRPDHVIEIVCSSTLQMLNRCEFQSPPQQKQLNTRQKSGP